MINKIKKYQDFILVVLLIVVTTFIYSYLFRISSTSIVGDAQRFNGYQAYLVKYSLTHFGQFGLWDQFIASGMSWVSHPGGAQFSPAAWIAISLFSDITRGSLFIFFIHTLTASIGYYFLCKVLGLKKITGFFVAVVSVCNQYFFMFAANGWFEEFFGFTLLPLTVGLLWLSFNKRNFLYAILGGFFMSLNFFSNSYYVFHYNAIAILWVGLAFLVRQLWFISRKKKKQLDIFVYYILSNAVFWLVTVGIAAVKLLPLLEFRSISARHYLPLSIVDSSNGVMTFQFFQSLFRDFIIPAGHTNSFTHWTNDLALALLLLSAIYFLFKKTFKHGVFLALFVIGVWGYFAYRIPIDLYAFIYNFLPGFNTTNYPYRFMIIIYFAFLVCLGLGFDILICRKNKLLAFFGIFLGAVIIYGALFYNISSYNALTYPQIIDVKSDLKKTNFTVERPNDVNFPPKINGTVSKNLLTDLSIIIKSYRLEGRVYSNFSNDNALVNHIMLEEEIPTVHPLYNPIVPTYQYSIISPSSQNSIEQTIKRFKIFSVLNTRFQYQQKENFDYNCNQIKMSNANIKTTSEICNYLESRLMPLITNSSGVIFYDKNVLPRITVISNSILIISDNRFNDFSGFIAKRIMFHQDFDEHLITVLSGGSSYIDDYNLKTLEQFKGIFIVEPKVKNKDKSNLILSQYEKNGGKVIHLSSKWINYESLHRRSSSIYTNKPAWNYSKEDSKNLASIFSSINSTEEKPYKIEIKKFTPEESIYKITTSNNNQVFQFSDSFYPGWKASIDGKKTSVYMADGLVKAVIVPQQGTHLIRFYYDPDSFKKGAFISVFTVFFILGGVSFYIFKRRRLFN